METSSTPKPDSQGWELVLGGSGVMALAHIGVLKAAEEHNLKIRCITGVSLGAVIAALYANGYGATEMHRFMVDALDNGKSKQRKAFDPQLWLGVWHRCTEARRRFTHCIDLRDPASALSASCNLRPAANLRVIAGDLLTGKLVLHEGDNYDLPTALASAVATPGPFRPVRSGRRILIDGSLIHRCPAEFSTGPTIVACPNPCASVPHALHAPVDKWVLARETLAAKCACSDIGIRHVVINITPPCAAKLADVQSLRLRGGKVRTLFGHGKMRNCNCDLCRATGSHAEVIAIPSKEHQLVLTGDTVTAMVSAGYEAVVRQ